jgi:hypothetical protein
LLPRLGRDARASVRRVTHARRQAVCGTPVLGSAPAQGPTGAAGRPRLRLRAALH